MKLFLALSYATILTSCSSLRMQGDAALQAYTEVRQLCLTADMEMARQLDEVGRRTIEDVLADGYEGVDGFDEFNKRMRAFWDVEETFTYLRGAFVELEDAYRQTIINGVRTNSEFMILLRPIATHIRLAMDAVDSVSGVEVPTSLARALELLTPFLPVELPVTFDE